MLEGRLVGLREQRRDDVEVMHALHADPDHVAIADTHPFYPRPLAAGLGQDAVAVVCRYGFEVLGLERLSLETLAVNTGMQRTALACGFVEEGRLRSAAWYLGRRVDDVLYGLLADEWRTLADSDRQDEHDESHVGRPARGV